MSQPYPRNSDDPFALVPVDEALMDAAAEAARNAERRRAIIRFHEHEERVQRMLNAIEPDSYVRPHRHVEPGRPEVFVALRGSVLAVRFAEDGAPLEAVVAGAEGAVRGIEVPPGAWHAFISLEPGTVLFEVSQGPYDPTTAKHYAPWAPPEDDRDAGLAFIAAMRSHFEQIIPELAARNRIEAEEDEIC
jgi:cupin fold WbuC family metalloprotein